MRFLKYAMLTLLIAIIADASLVFAYDSPTIQAISTELVKNEPQYTGYKKKNVETYQRYTNQDTYTRLTNPCPNCKIMTQLFTEGGDFSIQYITTTGQTKVMNDPTSMAAQDNYKLKYQRYDITALTTFHWGLWYVNPSS